VGILDYLLKNLSPEARKELAKEAAKSAASGVGDAIYAKADEVRREIEESARRHREQEEKKAAAIQKQRDRVQAAQQIEDELAMLKKKVERERKK
jgi:hypothetical protein